MQINKTSLSKCYIHHNLLDNIFTEGMTQGTIEGIDAILDEWAKTKHTDMRWLAYILATTYHETAKTMRPIEEYGKGKNRRYGKKEKYDGTMYANPDKVYYGRGYPQLTWYENYEKMGKIFHLPLLYNPELMLEPKISARVMIYGMINGSFTGVKLSTYFNSHRDDKINARKIINGLDKAQPIASYYDLFLKCLTE